MEKLGRRPLLIFPMGGMVLSFLVLTVSLNLLTSGDFEVSSLYYYCKNVVFFVCGLC